MAKASKSTKSETPAPKKKAAAPKKAAATSKPAPPGIPGIDTSFAAETAARMLAAKFGKSPASTQPLQQESAMFRQMKAGLNKPHAATVSNLLDKAQGPEQVKGHPQMKQVGQNQTFGADVTRSGVPRRTPG